MRILLFLMCAALLGCYSGHVNANDYAIPLHNRMVALRDSVCFNIYWHPLSAKRDSVAVANQCPHYDQHRVY